MPHRRRFPDFPVQQQQQQRWVVLPERQSVAGRSVYLQPVGWHHHHHAGRRINPFKIHPYRSSSNPPCVIDGQVRIHRQDFHPEKPHLDYLRSQSKPISHHIQIEPCSNIQAQTDRTGKVAGGVSYGKWYGVCILLRGWSSCDRSVTRVNQQTSACLRGWGSQ